VQAHDLIEEDAGHRHRRVWATQGDEVGVLGEAVDDGEDEGLATHSREALNEVHGDVGPNGIRHRQWLEQAGGMQVF
jgi:hypothetical protein